MDKKTAALELLNNPDSTSEEKELAQHILASIASIPVTPAELVTAKSETIRTPVTKDLILEQLRAEFKTGIVSPKSPSAEELKHRARWARLEEVCAEIAKFNPNDLNFGNPVTGFDRFAASVYAGGFDAR